MRFIPALLACALLSLGACSAETIVTVASPAKVDLEQLVSTGKAVPVGGITPAGQPDAAAFQVFADSGYAAVIDLRTAGENRGLDEQVLVEELGMTYLSMPITQSGITFENAALLDAAITGADGPVLVHCASSNRVGALLALRASLAGADDEDAVRIGRKAGMTGLEPVVRGLLTSK